MKKCCYCLSLTWGARLIGLVCLVITLGLFVSYLVFLEEVRRNVFENLYEFPPWCRRGENNFYLDMLIDSLFEYSILSNICLFLMCSAGTCCTRWLLMPWLVMYFLNSCIFLALSCILFVIPMPKIANNKEELAALRTIGLVPLVIAFFLGYCWLVILALFNKMSSENAENLKHGGSGSLGGPLLGGASNGDSHLFGDSQQYAREDPNSGCCSMQLKTGVQIICGLYAIISSLILVSYYATLEKSIIDKYILYFGSKSQYAQYQQQYERQPTNPNYDRPDTTLIEKAIPTCIIIGIVTNIFAVVGCCVTRWRRVVLLTPWLVFYGVGILVAIVCHQWFTTDCWVEEKVYGIVSLGLGFVTMIVWTLVWIVSAEAYEKPKLLIGRNPLGFQRL